MGNYKTADGLGFESGSLLFSHYTMRPLVVGRESLDGWFNTQGFDLPGLEPVLGTDLLDGSRLCSLEHAVRMGWMGEEQVSAFRLEHQCPKCWDAPCRCES